MTEEIAGEDKFREFVATRRSKATQTNYVNFIKRWKVDPNQLLAMAFDGDRRKAEDVLIKKIVESKHYYASSTISVILSTFKAFFDYYETPLNWKRIKQIAPPARFVSTDRAPTMAEIRAALKESRVRERFLITLLASSGLRVGALPGLKVGHVETLPSGVMRLRVYAGEPEEYRTFGSPEAVASMKEYFAAREEVHEKIEKGSPLFRDHWNLDWRKGRVSLKPEVAQPIVVNTIKGEVRRLWIRARVRADGSGSLKVRPEFKAVHGFRKFFKTRLSMSGLSYEDSETLLGHFLQYYRPTPEHMEEEYLKAVPLLTIAEAEQLRTELSTTKEKHDRDFDSMRLELLEMKQRVDELRANIPYAVKLEKLGVPPMPEDPDPEAGEKEGGKA